MTTVNQIESNDDGWSEVLGQEKTKPYFQDVMEFVKQQRQQGKTIYPPQPLIFSSLKHTSFKEVKVVIIGQDPYHGPNQANGLCFSVNPGVPFPPSLRNIFKEMGNDLNMSTPTSGDLTSWADQGVLLLNTVLTVEAAQANSHQNKGWEQFTDAVIDSLNKASQHIVFLLWGSHAQKKAALINNDQHTLLKAPHPSPLSAHRGFFGCQHFSKANQALVAQGQTPIDWTLS